MHLRTHFNTDCLTRPSEIRELYLDSARLYMKIQIILKVLNEIIQVQRCQDSSNVNKKIQNAAQLLLNRKQSGESRLKSA